MAITLAIRGAGDPQRRQRRVVLLLAYISAVYAGLAALRRDAWPFVTHGYAFHRVDSSQPLTYLRFSAIDANGREWPVSAGALSPIHERTLHQWMWIFYQTLDAPQQQRVMAFLLSRVESARQRLAANASIGHARWLGPLAAPPWFYPLRREEFSSAPYTGLRVDLVTCIPDRKLRSQGCSSRTFAEVAR